MMTQAEKRALFERARDLDLTPSEMLRRAGSSYDAAVESTMLEYLAEDLERSNAEVRKQLDEVMGRVDVRLAEIKRLREGR